jgi:dTDP-4-amino-4,6-dideoxygalactose transaminase
MLPGFNAKMDELRAAIGIQSLEHFPETLARRRAYGSRLVEAFQEYPDIYVTQSVPEHVETNFQNLGVLCLPAEKLGLSHIVELYHANGVAVRAYFDPLMNHFPGFTNGPALPVSERIWRTLISVPIHSRMSEATLVTMERAISNVAKELRSAH